MSLKGNEVIINKTEKEVFTVKRDMARNVEFCNVHRKKYLDQVHKEDLNDNFGNDPEVYRKLFKEAESCDKCKMWTSFYTP